MVRLIYAIQGNLAKRPKLLSCFFLCAGATRLEMQLDAPWDHLGKDRAGAGESTFALENPQPWQKLQ